MTDNSDADSKLVELLDDALHDFEPPPTKSNDDDLEEFMQKVDQEATQKAAEKFQAMLENVIRQKDEVQPVPAAGKSEDSGIAKSISKLVFSEDVDDRELEKELEKLSLSKGSIDDLMDTIVQTAVSKEAMYPAIKELHSKFGPFLKEKAKALDPESLHRYKEQYRILGLLRQIYDDESSGSNEEEAKQARASKIAQLWLEMQKYGLPPSELSTTLHRGFSIDQVSADDENLNGCSIM